MLALIVSIPLIPLALALGVGVPFLALHFERQARAERRRDAAVASQRELLEGYEATITAYRELQENVAWREDLGVGT